MSQATSWNSELPSGHNPFWIKDDALIGLGLQAGDAVGIDTASEPADGELALVEVELEDLSDRLVRRFYMTPEGDVRLVAANPAFPELRLTDSELIVLGVVRSKVIFESNESAIRVVEQPIS